MRPGTTILPATSRTSCAAASLCGPTLATLPPEKATSAIASMFCDGSMTRPFRKIRSYVMGASQAYEFPRLPIGLRLSRRSRANGIAQETRVSPKVTP